MSAYLAHARAPWPELRGRWPTVMDDYRAIHWQDMDLIEFGDRCSYGFTCENDPNPGYPCSTIRARVLQGIGW